MMRRARLGTRLGGPLLTIAAVVALELLSGTVLRIPKLGRYGGMCTCGHSEKDHAPCGKCLVEGCECEVFDRQKA